MLRLCLGLCAHSMSHAVRLTGDAAVSATQMENRDSIHHRRFMGYALIAMLGSLQKQIQ